MILHLEIRRISPSQNKKTQWHIKKSPSRIKQQLKKNQAKVEEEIKKLEEELEIVEEEMQIVEEEMGKETICERQVSYRRCMIEVITKDY